jgi:hypothetical protein
MFPLPTPSQANFTKWNGHIVSKGKYNKYKVVWIGESLDCTVNRSTNILSKHLFILQKNKQFVYAVYDHTLFFKELSTRFYTKCFPNITAASIPANNRTVVSIGNALVELPFIPERFMRTKMQRSSRKRKAPKTSINTRTHFPMWINKHSTQKLDLKPMLAKCIYDADSGAALPDPFDRFTSASDLMENEEAFKQFQTVAAFVYHYCRDNLGLPRKLTSECEHAVSE